VGTKFVAKSKNDRTSAELTKPLTMKFCIRFISSSLALHVPN